MNQRLNRASEPRSAAERGGPSLYVIDVENTFGRQPADLPLEAIAAASHRLAGFLRPALADTVLVACNPAIVAAVRRGFADATVLSRGGPNGADDALLAAASDDVVQRHSRLVLCSGDRSLVPLALRARVAGLRVVNVACRHQRHRTYRAAVDSMIDWPPMGIARRAA